MIRHPTIVQVLDQSGSVMAKSELQDFNVFKNWPLQAGVFSLHTPDPPGKKKFDRKVVCRN